MSSKVKVIENIPQDIIKNGGLFAVDSCLVYVLLFVWSSSTSIVGGKKLLDQAGQSSTSYHNNNDGGRAT